MIGQVLVYGGIIGLICLLLFWTTISTKWSAWFPKSAANPTVVGLTNIIGNASKYASYATAHGALYTLRLVDFENPNLDISGELTTIDSKLAAAVKLGNLEPPKVQGQG